MNRSETIENLAISLAKFQAEVKNPPNTKVNPYYKSKYAPLDEVLNTVRPILGKYGLSFFQNQITDENGKLGVITILLHSSGEFLESDAIFAAPEKNTPQGLGSVSTYLRRYQLSSVLGIASEDDDDGNTNESPLGKAEDKKNDKNTNPQNESIKSIKNETIIEANKDNETLENTISQITERINVLRENKFDDKTIGSIVKGVKEFGKMNYAGIKDINIAQKVLDAVNNVKIEGE